MKRVKISAAAKETKKLYGSKKMIDDYLHRTMYEFIPGQEELSDIKVQEVLDYEVSYNAEPRKLEDSYAYMCV